MSHAGYRNSNTGAETRHLYLKIESSKKTRSLFHLDVDFPFEHWGRFHEDFPTFIDIFLRWVQTTKYWKKSGVGKTSFCSCIARVGEVFDHLWVCIVFDWIRLRWNFSWFTFVCNYSHFSKKDTILADDPNSLVERNKKMLLLLGFA